MARETKLVTIDAKGRDLGRRYLLTEMSADKGARWANKLIFALMNANEEIPAFQFEHAGFAGVAQLMPQMFRMLANLPCEIAQPLLDELMTHVKYVPDNGAIPPRALMQDDIEEIATYYTLQWEMLQLHVGFSETVDTRTPA